MATLIPALSTCTSRMTSGERRLAERLERKLEDDYMLWYDVPVGPKQSHPDFVVIHPRRGVLILEVKDWKLATIQRATRQMWEIIPNGEVKVVINPLAQARHCAIQVVNAMERDPPLVHADGPHQGKLAFPWGHGVVLSNITRKQFTDAGLGEAIEPHYVICSDEMTEAVDAEAFQQRLWDMFPHAFRSALTLPQLDRVRWIMFPEVRVQTQGALFDDSDASADLPDVMRVMDLQQEQLARSLGEGHRVIHGVAGSGKTMILGYRAEYLAKASTDHSKPILVLCYNEPLAVKLVAVMEAKGLADRVHVRNFHKWCRQQLVAYGQSLPRQGPAMFDEMVDFVIRAVQRKQIPSGQYMAVMIDEGHDFAPEWLTLVTQMVDPSTNSLLLLYDDAQAIYKKKRLKFTLKSVGIEATRGRSTILKVNYRNTRQILQVASLFAGELLKASNDDLDNDDSPTVAPVGCGREGAAPLVIRLPSLNAEAAEVAERLSQAHQEGFAWSDMAIICRNYTVMDICAHALERKRLPHQVRRKSGSFNPNADTIKVMTMHVSKGLEFPLVALPGIGQLPTPGQDEQAEAQLFYVASTRATSQLILTSSADSLFSRRLAQIE
ncbi:MAG: NERD domain-containing protein/DEAD/DEAH box helicase [Rhodoferax sp.]|nr:NERD domain-containing protein/DEAD/DEAH box helicase [Giesbergeria sp.]MBP8183289.1 NERD domain-containing protein/DEAD/DEAH box helicase [Rhodoferax sp.]